MRSRLILAAVVLALAGTSSPAQANPPASHDHLKCFKIRDSLVSRRTIYLADLFPDNPFAAQSDCRLRLPARHFCINVAKENVLVNGEPFTTLPVPGEEARDYLCYDVHCDRDRLNLGVADQFGIHAIRTRKADFLCLPANKVLDGAPTPTPTVTPPPPPTPTATPTPPPPPSCDMLTGAVGICGGVCPNPSEQCLYDPQLGCACVPDFQACGERVLGTGVPQPICGGLCPGSDDFCFEDLAARGSTACRCGPIN